MVSAARLLLVHGAFHGRWCWQQLVPALDERGVEADVVDLPLSALSHDADALAHAMGQMDGPLVVVGHSYGGAVITAGASGEAGGRPADHLVYLAALMQDPAVALDLTPTPAMSAVQLADDGAAILDPAQAAAAMYHLCPADVVEWAVTKLRPMRIGPEASDRPAAVAWRSIPSTYIVCRDDRAIHPDDQRRMGKHANECIELDADHSPFFSRVDELADVLSKIAHAVSGSV